MGAGKAETPRAPGGGSWHFVMGSWTSLSTKKRRSCLLEPCVSQANLFSGLLETCCPSLQALALLCLPLEHRLLAASPRLQAQKGPPSTEDGRPHLPCLTPVPTDSSNGFGSFSVPF